MNKADNFATILVVDDQPFNLMVLSELLGQHYHVLVAKSGAQALSIVEKIDKVDLILLDIMMPEMDGKEVCRRLKRNSKLSAIPIIFVTAINDEVNEAQGLESGAVDYITKPVSPPIVLARVATHLKLRKVQHELQIHNQLLEVLVAERTEELLKTQQLTIFTLAMLAEYRDPATGAHIKRTQQYIARLAESLRDRNVYQSVLTSEFIERIVTSAPLHDIGKIGIPDKILLKPSSLTPAEFEIMKSHTTLGYNAIIKAETLLNRPDTFLSTAAEIALNHHERWDGNGYPNALKEEKIPLSARLMSVADVYDALISERVYKQAFSHEKAVKIILGERAKQFDPNIIDVFEIIHPQFAEIAKQANSPYLIDMSASVEN